MRSLFRARKRGLGAGSWLIAFALCAPVVVTSPWASAEARPPAGSLAASPPSVVDSLSEYYADRSAPAVAEPAARLLVIGIDGASWATLDPLIASGALPNLTSLKKRGRHGVLRSTAVPESAIAWTSMRTGVGPGVHGVFKFRSPTTRRASYWREFSRRGMESIVIAVPKVSAAEGIRGVVIEGWTARRDGDYVRPASLKSALSRAGFDPSLIMRREPSEYIARMETRTDVALSLMRHEPWRHAFVVYEYGDTVAHRFHLDSPEWTAVLSSIDREVGRLVASMRPKDAIMIVSDHGWTQYSASVDLNAWLIEEGITGWTSSIFSGNSVGLRSTNSGQSSEEQEREIARIETRLKVLVEPTSGDPVVARIRRTAEVFPGPASGSAVLDLLVDLTPGYHAVKATKRRKVFSLRRVDHHSRDGLYLLMAPGIGAGEEVPASILDVAPSALAFFGIEPVPGMAGVAMRDFSGADSAAQPGSQFGLESESGAQPEPRGGPPGGEIADEDRELLEKLRSLGYVE